MSSSVRNSERADTRSKVASVGAGVGSVGSVLPDGSGVDVVGLGVGPAAVPVLPAHGRQAKSTPTTSATTRRVSHGQNLLRSVGSAGVAAGAPCV
jgi:hypothetical protein